MSWYVDTVEEREAEPAPESTGHPLEIALRPGDKANLLIEPAFGNEDDLEEINGVGPMLGELLNEIGVYYFWQVAEWGPAEIEWVDNKLEHFKGRIERDEWVKQAKGRRLDEDGVAHQRWITVAHEMDDVFVVAGGLEAGETIVLDGVRQVRDGEHAERLALPHHHPHPLVRYPVHPAEIEREQWRERAFSLKRAERRDVPHSSVGDAATRPQVQVLQRAARLRAVAGASGG